MILTVTPNTALDRTAMVPNFSLNKHHTVKSIHSQPGGKGINVARVLKAFGVPAIASGFVGGETGKLIRMGLEREGIPTEMAAIVAESRTCMAIVDSARGLITEIDENGPEVSMAEVVKLTQIITRWAAKATMAAFCGSLPPGVPPDTYRKWVEIVQRAGKPCYVDAKGQALYHALEARPMLVKPNQEEAEDLVGFALDGELRIAQAIDHFLQRAKIAVVTLAERGAALGAEGERWRAFAPPVKVLNPVGSGDAFLAGFLVGTQRRLPLKECLRLAVAAGAANAQAPAAGLIRLEQIDRLASQVKIEALRG